MNALFIAIAIAIGAGVSLQPPINATMARTLGSPLLAATFSVGISLVLVVLAWASYGKAGGDWAQTRALPWWVVIGGVVGVVFVVGGVIVAPALGVALFFVCVVAGQLLGALIVDQFGAFGSAVKPINLAKLVGLGLVLAGAALVRASDH